MKTTLWLAYSYTLLLGIMPLLAQSVGKSDPLPAHSAVLIRADYAIQLPAGDIAKRFGWNSCASIGTDYKTTGNWLLGVEGRYLFGSQVNEDSLAINIATSDNYIIGESGLPADIDIEERGWWIGIKSGKVFPISPKRPDSGIFATVGIGYLQHQIRLQDLQNEVPQFNGDYIKGYDRLTGGWSLSQSIGYMHLPERGLRFFFALEAIQGFTTSLRDYNFDTQTSDKAKRLDMLFGAKLGWILPLYTGTGTNSDGTKTKRYYVD